MEIKRGREVSKVDLFSRKVRTKTEISRGMGGVSDQKNPQGRAKDTTQWIVIYLEMQ